MLPVGLQAVAQLLEERCKCRLRPELLAAWALVLGRTQASASLQVQYKHVTSVKRISVSLDICSGKHCWLSSLAPMHVGVHIQWQHTQTVNTCMLTAAELLACGSISRSAGVTNDAAPAIISSAKRS